jgi:hypothetical protein
LLKVSEQRRDLRFAFGLYQVSHADKIALRGRPLADSISRQRPGVARHNVIELRPHFRSGTGHDLDRILARECQAGRFGHGPNIISC